MTAARPGRWRGPLGLLTCLALALVLAALTPDPAQDLRRHWVTADPGTWASTPAFAARVVSVRASGAVAGEYGDPFVSRQALVVVGVQAQVREQVVQFSQVSLHTRDGHDYEPRGEFSTAGLGETQPGFTRNATVVFEVPPDRLAGATLVIDSDAAAVDRYADAIRIDLGLADPVAIGAETLKVPPSTVETT